MNTEMTISTDTNRGDKYPVSIPTDYDNRTNRTDLTCPTLTLYTDLSGRLRIGYYLLAFKKALKKRGRFLTFCLS